MTRSEDYLTLSGRPSDDYLTLANSVLIGGWKNGARLAERFATGYPRTAELQSSAYSGIIRENTLRILRESRNST